VGRLSFDPLDFSRQDSKTQLATLLDLVELPFDPSELDVERKTIFEQRTEVNRDAKALHARLSALPYPVHGLPEDEVSAADLLTEIREAQEQIDSNRRVRDDLGQFEGRLRDSKMNVQNLELRLEEARREVEQAGQAYAACFEVAEQLVDPDIQAIGMRVEQIEETNRQIRDAKARREIELEVEYHSISAGALTDRLMELDQRKAEGLKAAKMPLPDLGFDESGVIYKGVPFKQCSSAEQLRVSVAIAMAMNPTVRVILIRDASLLDSENMALIEEMAGERDMQVWLERVDESGEIGIVIEDGLVTSHGEVV
jgi:hypothetical protein